MDGSQRDARALPAETNTGPSTLRRSTFMRGKPIFLGALGPMKEHWEGHLYDVRFWDAPRPALALRRYASSLPSRWNSFLGTVPSSYALMNGGQQRFPSIRINAPAASTGKHYYEATIRYDGLR